MSETRAGRLTLVSTPIGNLGDLSPRAEQTLRDADFWIVEDTRVSGKLASHLEIRKPMRVFNEHTNPHQITRYREEIAAGAQVALLTDGGTPAISDPGAILTDECHTYGIAVDAIPGPSAPITALALSGFFAQRFVFLGFLGRKAGTIKKDLGEFADSSLAIVLFESPHRIVALLEAAAEALPERRYAVCREISKTFQQVVRGKLPTIPTEAEMPRLGEITVVIEGRRKQLSNLG